MGNNKKASSNALNIRDIFSKENSPLFTLAMLVVFAIVAIVISTVVFKINVVVACLIVILEAGLGACLNKIPLWIHGLVFIAQIVCGIMASQVPFMLLMAFMYVFSIAFLYIWEHHE